MVAVAGKPSEIRRFVNDQHVVVGVGVVGKSHVLRLIESFAVAVVAGGIEVVVAITVFAPCSKVKRLSVRHEEGVVNVAIDAQSLNDSPFSEVTFLLIVTHNLQVGAVGTFGLQHHAVQLCLILHDVASFRKGEGAKVFRERISLEEIRLVHYHAVHDGDPIDTSQSAFALSAEVHHLVIFGSRLFLALSRSDELLGTRIRFAELERHDIGIQFFHP